MDQTQREFLVEIEELVEQILVDLDELRAARTDRNRQRQLIDQVFRRVHSVKGLSAAVGLDAVSHIAHEFENLLDAARAGRIVLDDDVLDLCERATDALSESLSLAASGIVEPSRRTLFDQLQAATQSDKQVPTPERSLERLPSGLSDTLNESEKQRLARLIDQGSAVFMVSASFDMGNFDEEFSRLKEKLSASGEVISTSPAVDVDHPEKINFRVVYACTSGVQDLQANSGSGEVAFEQIVSPGQPPPANEEISQTLYTTASVASLSNFVRADLDKLDQLISSTHELFRATANAFEVALAQKEVAAAARQELGKLDKQIRSAFLGVEDELINLRMVSLGPTLQRAARAGRAAARQSAKDVDFQITGTDLRLDKLLADAIADPLIHLVRNAVDHGIETAEERKRVGKNVRGTIRIEAFSEGSQSTVRVTDDGRGIDSQLISEAAKKLGITEPDSTLDFERSLRLIFRPGFTTVDSVSDLSGRGVGLDVVETAVEQVGGGLRVSSKPGGGSTFEIRLPVTFGLLTATVVVSEGNRYCIAASQVMNGVTEGHEGAGLNVNVRQSSLRELLGNKPANDSDGRSKFIEVRFLEDGADANSKQPEQVRLIVDDVLGNEEVLVRNLGRHAGRWYGVAGATELRDGSIALVLDLPRLLSAKTAS
ncbi:MAG: ATP-binding protein [Acidobacteriota bacterium]|nr:ATP-binding protein [Acidobacteriota bacterium]